MIKDIPDWSTAIKEAKDKMGIDKPKDFQEACNIIGTATILLLISKNQKYGKGNILNAKDFGMSPIQGTALRMNDKFERLKNGLKGVDLGKEGFIESAGDLIGYNAIIIMLELGWYQLPLKDESKTTNV